MLSTLPIAFAVLTLVAALPAAKEPIYIDLPVNQEIPTIASASPDTIAVTPTALPTQEAEVTLNSVSDSTNDTNSKSKREDATNKPAIDSGDRVKVEKTIGAGKPSLKFIQTFLAQVLQICKHKMDSDNKINYFINKLLDFQITEASQQMQKPKPLVDTIKEEEKYGNDGEKLGQIGRSIVGGVEKLTNFISTAVDIPYEALKRLSRRATAALNNIGGKLVGIAV